MEPSILKSIKKLLGLSVDDTSFDEDVLTHINSVLSTLAQIGASPSSGALLVQGNDETWDLLIEGRENVHLVKSYVYVKVRLMFDPPTTSFAIQALERIAEEYEFRINILEDVFKTPAPATSAHRTAPTIATLVLQPMTEGVHTTNLLMAYGNPSAFVWSIAEGELPSGLAFSSLGIISGIPTAPGDYDVTLRCSNGTTPDAFVRFVGTIAASTITHVDHSIFGVTAPSDRLVAAYNDGGNGLWVGNQFYLENDVAYSNVSVVGVRVYVPSGAPAGLKTTPGQIGVARRASLNDFWNGPSEDEVLPAMVISDFAGELQDGWNDLFLDTPIALGMMQGVIAAIKWDSGGYYLYATNNWTNDVAVKANDDFGLYLSEHTPFGGTSIPVRGWNTVGGGMYTSAWYGVDIIVRES